MANTRTKTHKQALNIHVFIVNDLNKWLKQNNAECIECVEGCLIDNALCACEPCITCDYEPALAALNMSIKDLTENQIKIMQEELHKQIEYYNA